MPNGPFSRRRLIALIGELRDELPPGVPRTTGNVYFLDSTTGSNSNDGLSKDQPLATLAYAVSLCTAAKGDVIVIFPGHAESIAAASAVTIDKSGIKLFGLGNGAARPTFTFITDVTALITVSAANVAFENIRFVCSIDNQTKMVSVTGADVSFTNCEFITNTGTVGAAIGILTAATATRLIVRNCQFRGPATNSGTTTTAQIQHEVGIDYEISGCIFHGKCTQNILNATACLGGTIANNIFVTYTGTKSIAVHASSTPMIVNNRMNVPSGTAPIVAAAGFVAGNVYSAAAGVTAGTAATV